MKKYPIMSYWQNETGRFDHNLHTFTNRKFSEIKEKEIHVEYDPETDTVNFRGGPAGYESYNFTTIEGAFETFNYDKFSICAGTINSWPRCDVKLKDFLEIIQKIKEERNDAK